MKLFTILAALHCMGDTPPPPTPLSTSIPIVEPITLSGHYHYTSCRYQFVCNAVGNKCNLTKICHPRECLTFNVANGTQCDKMHEYCKDNIEAPYSLKCEGSGIAGKEYTCCTK